MNRLTLTLLLLFAACYSGDTTAPYCGDAVLGPDEVCDGQAARTPLTCQDYGFLRGEIACSPDCLRPLTDACVSTTDKPPACGDEILDPGEECDMTLPPKMDCVRLGYVGGQLACSASCGLDRSGCGDVEDSTSDDDSGPSSDPTACPEGSTLACYQGDVWSYSCGQRTDKSKDCGTSGPTGESFCMGDDLYILHDEVGCDVDQCTSHNAPKLQKTCTSGCTNGSCVECSPSQSSHACSGGDVYWYDACGLPSGLKDDCGQDEYVGSLYCSGSDVYQDHREVGCSTDHCTAEDTPVKQEDCGPGSCSNGTCVECEDGDEDVQGCAPASYCPEGERTRQCIDNEWSGWSACEADSMRYYGDGGQHCGGVICLSVSSSGGNSSLKATLSKDGGGNFDNDVDLVLYAPGTGDILMYGCQPTDNLKTFEFSLPMDSFDIDLGDTLQVNAQVVSPCNIGGFHISGNATISQCTK